MKKGDRKARFSLTLLYSTIAFCVMLATLIISGALSYLLARLDILIKPGVEGESGAALMMYMVLISAIVGVITTLVTSRIPLNPFNRIINSMNRLAAGDFKARLQFGKIIRGNAAFVELSDSFNTMAQQLENTEMLRGDFVNNFSHEFKTPIVSIAGFAKLLRRGDLTEEQKEEYLAIIEEESLRLSAMATNVLELTKIQNQTILTDVTSYNLSEQLRACVLLLEEQWSKKSLVMELEFDEYEICANEELLMQVWVNLLDNAVKFSPPTGEVVIRITETGDKLVVCVTNYGSEIPVDKQSKIWNKFYQGDESHTSQGNGIGLAIVKYIVELHRGSVSVSSGQGVTTFRVELPKRH